MNSEADSALWPLPIYFAAVLVVVGAMLGLSHVLGQRHKEPATGQPYESGIAVTGSARLRFAPRFYLMALFFLIFDLEAVYLFAWAVAAREAGWAGYIEALVFIAILLVALVYLWRLGALDQGSSAFSGKGRVRKTTSDSQIPPGQPRLGDAPLEKGKA